MASTLSNSQIQNFVEQKVVEAFNHFRELKEFNYSLSHASSGVENVEEKVNQHFKKRSSIQVSGKTVYDDYQPGDQTYEEEAKANLYK